LIALLYRTGLRINEALGLYPKDLDLGGGSIRVLNGKGGKSRTVGVDPGAAAVIERWLEARSRCLALSLGGCHDLPLLGTGSSHAEDINHVPLRQTFGRCTAFCTLDGNPMPAAYVRVMLKRLACRAGIDKRVHAHGLRHTHAAQFRAEGVDIAIISRQLGHSNISTTARYLDHLAPRAVIETMRNRAWSEA
jgi:site-specific recombinase XerD